jgi:hypothetical protein
MHRIQPLISEVTDGLDVSEKRVIEPGLLYLLIMKKKTGKVCAVLAIFGLLPSCAQMSPLEAQFADTRKAAEGARTYAGHISLAEQYESMEKKLLLEAEEKKKQLQHYEEKSYLYGRHAQDRQSHAWASLRKYQQEAKEAIKQASFHRKMASRLAKGN